MFLFKVLPPQSWENVYEIKVSQNVNVWFSRLISLYPQGGTRVY